LHPHFNIRIPPFQDGLIFHDPLFPLLPLPVESVARLVLRQRDVQSPSPLAPLDVWCLQCETYYCSIVSVKAGTKISPLFWGGGGTKYVERQILSVHEAP
jgi:hypothetical protein